jgi:FkbM family methyltransferase
VLRRNAMVLAMRAYPFKSGLGRIANHRLTRRIFGSAPPGHDRDTTVVRTRAGARLVVQPNDYGGRTLALFGEYDPKVTYVFDRLLRAGDNVLDIGANHGAVTLHCAARLNGSGAVHAVEPQPELVEQIRRSVQLSGYSGVTVHEVAVSDTSGQSTLSIPAGHTGAASIAHGLNGGDGCHRTIRTIRTADFLTQVGVAHWRLWKIDVEGHEAAVIRGAFDYLRDVDQPDVIVFEEHGRPVTQTETAQLLTDLGYRIFALPRALVRVRLEQVDRCVSRDYVAVSNARFDEVSQRLRIAG